ncbi:type I polyketide synthase [Desmonostoc muscorum LEGE 12446]|uniref:Type I polyketide synthase n=1 Tax=Desmonostoc muscorum LEGE 12446 TaxID=1828758 RepID=A0A8J7DDU0_DESMC|nr:type I polyketide synthase [Desmonostoc muscorum]MCF2144947.1 type I polyketide synthase [Desmonostoc muscorum LEGE 12446]
MSKISERFAHMSPLKQALLALEEMSYKLNRIECQQTEPIAIVGMGCRFPGGANNPELFWELLENGVDATTKVPVERWNIDADYDANPEIPGRTYTRQGAFLDVEVDKFDAEFFGLAAREVVSMDPQQRLLLEVSWEALENAGQAPQKLTGSQTGIFIGINTSDYSQLHLKSQDASQLSAYFFTGNTSSVAAGRLSYILGLEGPSVALDTACSSSLVTVHLACQSLRARECQMALAGGVNLMLSSAGYVVLSRMRALAVDGRCKTFDATADGYGRGEGCGIVVLKRLSDALANGDRILALIRGSAMNHDGRSSGLTVPNGLAQQKLIRAALANARIEPNQVSYLEVHGTGTALGDPIEVEALGSVLCNGRSPQQPLILGSVKTNIGHLEAAAGIAGLIKLVLAMQHKQIPPHLHLQNPNPAIRWDDLPMVIPRELTPWSTTQTRIGGISSFGMSGTNAHIILEEAPAIQPVQPEIERSIHLLCLSAKNEAALKALASRMISHLETHPSQPLADVCFTANTGRSHFAHRLAVVAEQPAQVIAQLTAFTAGNVQHPLLTGVVPRQTRPKIVFLFTGQGSQYVGMGRQLYEQVPTFRKALERCDQILRPHLERSLLSVLYPEAGTTPLLDETAYTQPALFALEYALFELWQSWGITPDAVMGHSVGEYVAACVAGVFSLEDGLKLIAQRGRLMQTLPANGAMAAIFTNIAQVTSAIAPDDGQVSIAAVNGPNNIVISGAHKAVQAIISKLEAQGVDSQQLNVSHAFHSPLTAPILDTFEDIAAQINYSSPKIRMISNLTGSLVEGEVTQPEYWRRHMREAVQFSPGMQTLYEQGYQLFVEIGPHPVLLGMGRRCLPDEKLLWLPSLRKGQYDLQQQLQSLAELYIRGIEVDWSRFDQDYPRQRLELPTYPFVRSPYWIELPKSDTRQASLRNDWLYEVEWQPKPRILDSQPTEGGSWLIFADNSGVGLALAEELEQRGQKAVLVFADEVNPTVKQKYWKINSSQPGDFQRLLTEVLGTDQPPCSAIVHLWSLDHELTENLTTDSLNQTRNCASVLHLVQALSSSKISQLPRLWLVTQGAQPIKSDGNSLAVAQSPVLGLGRVVSIEHPQFWGGLIDLAPENSPAAVTALLEEIWQPDGEPQVAFREGQRYVSRLIRSEKRQAPTQEQGFRVSADATYLITDGCSSLSLKLAEWIVEQGARHLVLLEHNTVARNVSKQLQQLQRAGAEIKVIHGDISQEAEIAEVFAEIAQSLPPLRGIIYVDDVINDGLLLKQDWESFGKFLNSKVAGVWNLHKKTEDLPLDFLILFSSIVSQIGSPAQGNYAAVNAFLDTLAEQRRLQGLPILSINWATWQETDIAAALGKLGEQRWQAIGIDLIAPSQGLQILQQLLDESDRQVTVMPVNWSKFFQQFPSGFEPPFLSAIAPEVKSSNLSSENQPSQLLKDLEKTPPNKQYAVLVSFIQTEALAVLGLDPSQRLQPHIGFFEMGMDSLMALDLKNRLQAAIAQEISVSVIFEYSNIESLSRYLISEFFSQESLETSTSESEEDPEEMTQLLAEIQQLSEAELEALIDQGIQNIL